MFCLFFLTVKENTTPVVLTPPVSSPIPRSNSPIPAPHTPNGRHRNGPPITLEHHFDSKTNSPKIGELTPKSPISPEGNGVNSNGNMQSEKPISSDSENEDSESRPNVYIEPPTQERVSMIGSNFF